MKNIENEDKVATLHLKVPSDNTFVIIHNTTNQYLVDPYILSSFSLFFRQKYFEEKITEYSQKDRYNERIFSIFINLSQGIEQKISLNDIFSLQRLSESWKCQRLSTELTALLQSQPEIEVKIAEIVDAYQLTGKLPNQKSFKASMIESFIETNTFHYIDRTLLMCFMNFAKQKACEKRKLNSFIVEHCKLIPDDSTEIVQYIDPHTLSTNELDFFCQCPGTMMLRLITDEAKRRNKTIQTKHKNKNNDNDNDDENDFEEEEEEDTNNKNESNKNIQIKNANNKGQFLKITPPLYGLMASIGIACGGDPVLKGKIRISASSNDPSVLVQKNDQTLSVEGNDPYIQLVFPTSIKIDKYEIQNTSLSTIPQWSLFGSNDFKQWELIDSVYSPKEKFEPNEVRSIKLEKEAGPFSIFQLKKLESPKNDNEIQFKVKYFDVFNESEFNQGASNKFKIVVTTSNNALHRLASPRHKGNWY